MRLLLTTALLTLAAALSPVRADLFYSAAEYNALYNEKVALDIELKKVQRTYGNERDLLHRRIQELDGKIKTLEDANAQLKKAREDDDRRAKGRESELEKRITILREKSTDREKKLLEDAARKESDFQKEIEKLRKELQDERTACLNKVETLTRDYEKKIGDANTRINGLNEEIARLKKLSDTQKAELSRMSDQAKALEEKLSKEISEGQIRLKRHHDRLIINIDDRISFDSGSSDLKKEILPALDKISDILERFPENTIMIEGHTDNVPIRTVRFRDNWQLSTERALSVLAHLMRNKKQNPARFAAAGYGEYNPIVPNDTSINRGLNRRVDIVVIPSSGK